jgi:heme/copper-type cytochrome/quinol oxidase subunit 4
VARGIDDFKRLLTEFRGLSTSTVGTTVVVPFAAALADLSPPWPKGIVLVTAIVELLVLVLVFQFLRTAARKRVIDAVLVAAVLLLAGVSVAYLWQVSLYTYEVPTTGERFVKGDECTPEAKLLYSAKCPDLGKDELSGAKFAAELLWTRRSVAAVRLRLVLLWTAAFVALSAALGSFLVYQMKTRRPRRSARRRSAASPPDPGAEESSAAGTRP